EKTDFLTIYENDPFIRTIAAEINSHPGKAFHCKGLSGSMDMVLLSTLTRINPGYHIVIAHDKEEAIYLNGDIQALLEDREPLLFPSSYKIPYQLDEVENANVLMRAEILNRILSNKDTPEIIVTHPD